MDKPLPFDKIRKANGLRQDKFKMFVDELNLVTLKNQESIPLDKQRKLKDRLDNRLTIKEIKALGQKFSISCHEIAGYGLDDPEYGGYYRVIIACIGDDVENDHQALILEDCDSPHLSTNFTLYLK